MTGAARPTIGVRREDKNAWERRAPLTPEHVKVVVGDGIRVLVQPSTNRVFANHEYEAAGAEITEDLSSCNVIFAVKEVPQHLLLPEHTYAFFAHVTKGQTYNMPLLQRILDRGCTLIDYEKIVDDADRRLVFFGHTAGQVGMIDTLWALGKRLELEGHKTPFSAIKQAHAYASLEEAIASISAVAEEIRSTGLPDALAPAVFGFTGSGNCSRGAQAIFDLLPHHVVTPAELASTPPDRHRLVKVVFKKKDRIARRESDRPFDVDEYVAYPERYRGNFDSYLPHMTVLVNCVYWAPQYPRLVTREALRGLFAGDAQPRLRVIGDITCDVGGSIEGTLESTNPSAPIYVYEPEAHRIVAGAGGRGPVIMAVDNLPAELPREASAAFGRQLLPFVGAMARADYTQVVEKLKLPRPVRRAIVTHTGRLTPPYSYLSSALSSEGISSVFPGARNSVLVLGAGFVAAPLVRYLLEHQYHVVVADQAVRKAEAVIRGEGRARAVLLDATSDDSLNDAVANAAIVVSLLPASLHVGVARACLAAGKPLVTTSYVSPEMKMLDREARTRGVLLLNEIGLDPGLDHMFAVKILRDKAAQGASLVSLTSWCGGLPAPGGDHTPFGYKLSWNPRGALSAARAHALYLKYGVAGSAFDRSEPLEPLGSVKPRYLKDGFLYSLAEGAQSPSLSRARAAPIPVEVPGLGSFEGYPNRDALLYLEPYGIPFDAKTLIRGTLRNLGYGTIFSQLLSLGFLEPRPTLALEGLTCRALMNQVFQTPSAAAFREKFGESLGHGQAEAAAIALTHVGFFDELPISIAEGSLLDVLLERMDATLQYRPEERDMVLMTHEFVFRYPGQNRTQRVISKFVEYGTPGGDTAMAKTVALPAAIAVRKLLEGVITEVGVAIPVLPSIYEPVLAELRKLGLVCQDEEHDDAGAA